jgi:hypothetical protein
MLSTVGILPPQLSILVRSQPGIVPDNSFDGDFAGSAIAIFAEVAGFFLPVFQTAEQVPFIDLQSATSIAVFDQVDYAIADDFSCRDFTTGSAQGTRNFKHCQKHSGYCSAL